MTSNAVLDNIYARRSVRSYSDKHVPESDIRELIKAGFHAANGVNAQKLRFSVVSDKTKLKKYSDSGKRLYLEYMQKEGIEHPGIEKNLNDPESNIFYDAPVAIFIYASPGIFTPIEDASLAAGNIMLAARSMGLGTCWIGLATGLGNDCDFVRDNNVPDGHRFLAAIILGYPKNEPPGPSVRDEPTILSWIR